MSTPTPTPRTDAYEYKAGWAAANYGERWKPMDFARELERELERELNAEREKVRVLRLACERLRDCDWVISLPDRMDAVREIAREALKKMESEK
jgi:hypothetical protein